MGELEENKKHLSSSWFCCTTKCFPISKTSSSKEQTCDNQFSETTPRKPGGWKSMPYILGNETFERLASIGLQANFTVFLLTQFHMDQVEASNVINIWSGISNFAPLLGAFVSDAYVGRFRTIAFSSFASLLGMVTMVLVVSIPQLHPPHCTTEQTRLDQCKGPTSSQFGFLVLGLGFLTVGSAGIRPCSLPFGLDQFDPTTDEGRKGINSFFNWYYATFTIVLIIALTVVVYIQDSVSWILGFGIPTGLMVCSIILFFVGTKMYIYVKPEGSVFSGIGESLVVAYKKRKLEYPVDDKIVGVYYDPPLAGSFKYSKLPLTNKFRFLNKAAMILEGEVQPDGSKTNPWQLCSIQQIEEVKCLIKVIPIWASGIITFLAMAQQTTFTVNQALKMDRHLGPNFQIPAGTLSVISMITLGLWIPFYDRFLVPFLRKITKIEGGITLLQRIGIGIVCSILSMVVAGIFERMRRNSAIKHGDADGIAPISVMWLAPQLILMGFSEAFNIIGQIEFYYKEFPESMRSLANSLFFVTVAGSNYLSTIFVTVVHNSTAKNGKPDWLTKNINEGKVDYFYYFIAVLGVVNMVYFLIVSRTYCYTSNNVLGGEEVKEYDVELNDVKK
ncbi:protein NRT1/ PTR FAMILY 2.13-like [Apium graveolens]|uniref:protein NRT1/ PTR FAMILY 2.13-like n=1 Tax=Apium graveolens TaxID=4045 RepID=UPI003D7BD9A5